VSLYLTESIHAMPQAMPVVGGVDPSSSFFLPKLFKSIDLGDGSRLLMAVVQPKKKKNYEKIA